MPTRKGLFSSPTYIRAVDILEEIGVNFTNLHLLS